MENRKELREQLTEGWVTFIRTHCKKGNIDRWMGDSINNPNNRTKHPMQINSMATYLRCNNGCWVNSRLLVKDYLSYITVEYCELFTAGEIWKQILLSNHTKK